MMLCGDQVCAFQFEGKVFFRRSIGPKVSHEQEILLVRKSCQSFPIDGDGEIKSKNSGTDLSHQSNPKSGHRLNCKNVIDTRTNKRQICNDLIGQNSRLIRQLRDKRKLRKPDDESANPESSDATLENRSFRCDECCKDYDTKRSLDDHMRFNHWVQKRFFCKWCNRRFQSSSDLQEHSIKEHNKCQPQEDYEECLKCKFCGKLFSSKRNLQRHVDMVHEQKKPFTCDRCGRGFAVRASLAIHIRGFHNREKPYKCNQCGNLFSQNSGLNRHIRVVHEKQKPFECDVCNRRFGLLGNLKRHVIEVHEKKKRL